MPDQIDMDADYVGEHLPTQSHSNRRFSRA